MIGYDGLGAYYQMSIKNGPFAELSRPAPLMCRLLRHYNLV